MVRAYLYEGKVMGILRYVHNGLIKYTNIVQLSGWDVRIYFYKIHRNIYSFQSYGKEICPDIYEIAVDIRFLNILFNGKIFWIININIYY